MSDCFNNDFAQTKIPRLCSEEFEIIAIKKVLREKYELIKRCYKYYASISPTGSNFLIKKNVYTVYAVHINYIYGL
jgi:hypothetical protein